MHPNLSDNADTNLPGFQKDPLPTDARLREKFSHSPRQPARLQVCSITAVLDPPYFRLPAIGRLDVWIEKDVWCEREKDLWCPQFFCLSTPVVLNFGWAESLAGGYHQPGSKLSFVFFEILPSPGLFVRSRLFHRPFV